jgi:DNA-binding XRE family transcriptional regulator
VATIVYGDFEWDEAKAATNLAKHGILFEEAVTAVVDPNAVFLRAMLEPSSGSWRSVCRNGCASCSSCMSSAASETASSVRESRPTRRRCSMSKSAKINQPTQPSLDDLLEIDVTKARVLGRGLRKDRKLPLRALREAADKTQDEVARLAGMDQSEISRVEQRDDLRVSTLRRYARALDAEIEIVALLPTGHRIKLDL